MALEGKSLPEKVDYFRRKLDKSWLREDRRLQPNPLILAKESDLDTGLPFLRREETLKEILSAFQRVLGKIPDVKKGLTCLAGGRGAGKTRVLYELCKSGGGDSYIKQAIEKSGGLFPEVAKEIDRFLFIPITFNNKTTSNSRFEFEKDPCCAVGARIFYSYFCPSESVEWEIFSAFFESYSWFLSLGVVLQIIWKDVDSLGQYTNIALLADESRAAIEMVSIGRSDLADDLSKLKLKNDSAKPDEKLVEVTTEHVLFNSFMSGLFNLSATYPHTLHIVVTSLSFQMFRNYQSLSAHPLDFAPLPPLTDDDVKELGKPILDQIRSSDAKNAEEAEQLLLGSNGYPRLVGVFLRALQSVNAASPTLHGSFLNQLLNVLSSNFYRAFFLDYSKRSELRRAIVLSVIGTLCKFSDLQPLISIGLLFPSELTSEFTPKMPSLVLWYLASQSGLAEVVRKKDNSSGTLAVAILLQHCLEIVNVDSLGVGKRFEYKVEHMMQVRILSYYLFQKGDTATSTAKAEDMGPTSLSRGTCTLTLANLFRLEDTQCTSFPEKKEEATACKRAFSDLSFVFPALLETGTFEEDVPDFSKTPLVSKLLFPKSDVSPGFDLLIEGVTPEGKHYVVAVQMKESAEGSSKILGKPDIADMLVKIVEYHPWVVNFIEAGCFRLLVIPQRSITDELREERVLSGAIVSIIAKKTRADDGGASSSAPPKEGRKKIIPDWVASAAAKAVPATILLRKEGIDSFFTPTFSHSS